MQSIITRIFLIKTSSGKRQENVEITGTAATSCFKRRLYNFLCNVTYSPSHRQAGDQLINIQSTLRTTPDLFKNVAFELLFDSNGASYTVCTQSDMCIYTHIIHNTETLVGQKNSKKGEGWGE